MLRVLASMLAAWFSMQMVPSPGTGMLFFRNKYLFKMAYIVQESFSDYLPNEKITPPKILNPYTEYWFQRWYLSLKRLFICNHRFNCFAILNSRPALISNPPVVLATVLFTFRK
jgi:hypothetical protein